MTDCVFCQILADKGPVSYVCQDETTVAFMDITPVNSGQVVVIPRVHAQYLNELDDATTQALFLTAARIGAALRHSPVALDGYNLFLADGVAAGQEVFHVHILVIPRRTGDAMKIHAQWLHPFRWELDRQAKKISQAYRELFPAA
jgi:histidine triad (HIT) family protein